MKVRSSEVGYPPGWEIMSLHRWKINSRKYSGFKDISSVNRFAARYRSAKLYTESMFEEMSTDLSDGYSGFIKLMFAYSSFEFLLRSIGVKQSACGPLLAKFNTEAWAEEVRVVDAEYRLHKHCLGFVNESNRQQLKKFMGNQDFNYTYLASSIRHAFIHGFLTPKGGRCEADKVADICDIISIRLMDIMDGVFFDKMRELELS